MKRCHGFLRHFKEKFMLQMGYALTKHMTTKHKTVNISFSISHLLFVLMLFSRKAIATDTLTQSEGILVGQTLVSSGRVFELGFFSPGNSSKQYIGIWYMNIYAQKAVWVANRENPISASDTKASLRIGKDGNLLLLDGMKNTIWSTNAVGYQPKHTIAVLHDNGNFILKNNITGLTSWEWFNYLGDTSMAGIILGPNYMAGKENYLSSWKSDDDPSLGVFLCRFTADTPPQIVVWKSSKLYWRSGPWDGSRFLGIVNPGVGYINGLSVKRDIGGSVYLTYNPPSLSHVAIFRLAPDGNLLRSDWDLVSQQGGVKWESMVIPCDVYNTCGPYGVCNRAGSRSCECLKGFEPKSMEEWEKGNWTSGCVRRTELLCGKNTSTFVTRKEKKDGFFKISTTKLPDNFIFLFNFSSLSCHQWCLSNCSCEAYAYPDWIGCMVWDRHLVDIQKLSSGGADLFLRLAHSELGETKKHMKIIISLSVILSVILFGFFLFSLRRYQSNQAGKEIDPATTMLLGPQTESPEIPMLDFNMLAVATNNFSETNKLGVGGFGPVYKGKLVNGKDIAVKRLSSHSGQGAEEFVNEILVISKLQHRNLVTILGYCIKGDEKLLIYEYLENKSLDTWLFDEKRAEQLDWIIRLNIIHGIARGLLYLHRDSRLRIIHRDLKASNVLLDDNMNPKISDFGSARAFQINQEQANTNRVVGTFGYMSPEYAMRGLLSEKSDVYSFGVLLLEIMSGMRITSFYDDGRYNLLCYAWNLWEEGKAIELMDTKLSSSCPYAEFIQCMHIGLLCVQDNSIDRPTMSTVVLMLTSEMELPQPKQPLFYKSMLGSGPHSQSSRRFYMKIVDDNVNVVTLPPGHKLTLSSHHPTPRHTGSQSSQSKTLQTILTQETKIKST